MISFDEFLKVELVTAKIVEVEDVAGKDKLFKLKISLGSEERQLIAGIKPFYSKEELEGKTIIVVANLAPARIAGIESQGMLLAAEDSEGKIVLLTADKEIGEGARVR